MLFHFLLLSSEFVGGTDSAMIIASKSVIQRQRCLSQEVVMAHSPEPGQRGTVVFRWVDRNGFRMRSQCHHQEVTTIWEMYGEENMR